MATSLLQSFQASLLQAEHGIHQVLDFEAEVVLPKIHARQATSLVKAPTGAPSWDQPDTMAVEG